LKKLAEALKDSGKKSASCVGWTGYVNDWLNDAAMQLVIIKQQKEKILDKLRKQETAKDSEVSTYLHEQQREDSCTH